MQCESSSVTNRGTQFRVGVECSLSTDHERVGVSPSPAVTCCTGADKSLTGSATLAGLPAVQLDRLQTVLNAAARLEVLHYRRRKFDHVSPLLEELQLHWLRVPERIIFRLAVLAYRCQHNMAPRYLAVQLNRVSNVGHRQRLRSSSSTVLDVPRTNRATIGDRAFNVSAA